MNKKLYCFILDPDIAPRWRGVELILGLLRRGRGRAPQDSRFVREVEPDRVLGN